MKKMFALLAGLFLVSCATALPTDDQITVTSNNSGFSGEWNRIATYTDGVDMATGPATLNFLEDGIFVSMTALCTAMGNVELSVESVDKALPEMVLDAGTMSMTYVESDCPGYTLSSLSYTYEVKIGEDGGETLTMTANYEGHVITEVYVR